jgi:DNA-binding XRE family transcriptional regulator
MAKSESDWKFKDKKQEAEFKEPVTKENCGLKLRLIREILGMSRRELAKIIGVSESTLRRLEEGSSLPTDEFMNRLQALCVIGAAKYAKLSATEKEKVSEMLGATGGVVAGVGGSIAAIGAAGAVSGFSAAGITSGLAAIGVGAMLTGIGVVAAIPVATGLLGYGLVKGIKAICEANNLSCTEVNKRWEIRTKKNKED